MRAIISLAVLCLTFSACMNKDEKVETLYIKSPEKKGSLMGYVNLVNLPPIPLQNKSGVKVWIEGTMPEISAITDSAGFYRLDSIPTGSYFLVFEKDGYYLEKRNLNFEAVETNVPLPTLYEDGINYRQSVAGAKTGTWLYQICNTVVPVPEIRYPMQQGDTIFTWVGTYAPYYLTAQEIFLHYDTKPGVTESQYLYRQKIAWGASGNYSRSFRWGPGIAWGFQNGVTYYGRIYTSINLENKAYDPGTGALNSYPVHTSFSPEFTFTPRW